MRLNRVQIKNFRSIAHAEIAFEPSCRILVGVNEAGKSNILRALSLLEKEAKPTAADIREVGRDEDPNQESYVRFIFTLDEAELQAAFEKLQSKLVPGDESRPFCKRGNQTYLLKEFCWATGAEILYQVDTKTADKRWSRWAVASEFEIMPNWRKPLAVNPPVTVGNPPQLATKFSLINIENLTMPSTAIADVGIQDVALLFYQERCAVISEKLPRTVYWTYAEANLLPAQIAIETFANSPITCRPLKNMFALAGIKDIRVALNEATKRYNGMRNLVRRVSSAASEYMAKVWKECGSIKINLTINGPVFECTIEDTDNVYDFARRSEGFKRFISFLLLISAQAETSELENALYLHDEPDISLHPSGARHLKDELIKISKTNYVVYSTHSIFMIDQDLISRHLIVTKKKEITKIEVAGESNFADEEVIYNAIGYSIFEHLKKNNIIFEGWRDKELFRIAVNSGTTARKHLKAKFAEVGRCHAEGVKDIPKVAAILELANRGCIIISDGDKVALEKQKNYHGHGAWYRYDQLLSEGSELTGEDFVKAECFLPLIEKIRSKHSHLPELNVRDFQASPRLHVIKNWLTRGRVAQEECKLILEQLKEEVFAGVKISNIEDKYFEMLEQLVLKMDQEWGLKEQPAPAPARAV